MLVLLAPLCAEATFSGIAEPLLWLGLPRLDRRTRRRAGLAEPA